jgi:modulator of FtsH protease HflK
VKRLISAAIALTLLGTTATAALNIGYRLGNSDSARDAPNQSPTLTGDEDTLDVNFRVFWVIKDAGAYLFKVENPVSDATIKAVAKSAIGEVVGKNQIEPILTANREPIQEEVRDLMQRVLDGSGVAVIVTRVQMQKADPPAQVIAGDTRTDPDRVRNEATSGR